MRIEVGPVDWEVYVSLGECMMRMGGRYGVIDLGCDWLFEF